MKPIRLLKGFLTVGGWTLLSRLLGFVREILILAYIGPGPLMDAFVAAFRLPNMFRRFFAEGAFNAAFVPMFSKKYEGDENPEGFARDAFNGLATVVLGLTAIAMIFMPAFVLVTAQGFAGDERFDLTVGFGRIVFPYIFFMSLAAMFSGVLNATGRFAAAAAAPVLLNVLAIGAMVLGHMFGEAVVYWLLWAIPIAGLGQLALVWIATERAGVKIRPGRPRWTPDMKHMILVAVPAALASGVLQVNLVVGQLVASETPKAVSWLYAADRLYQLPLGVVGIAVGIVLLPSLSRHLKAGDEAGSRDALSRAAEFALLLTMPSAVALAVIPAPLVTVLFERGATSAADTAAIALAVAIYGLGLPAFVLQKVLQPLFFAREDTKTPLRFAILSMIVNAVVAFGGAAFFGWVAAAVAATTAAWVQVALLAIYGRRLGEIARFDARFHKRVWRITAVSFAMGAVTWGAAQAMAPLFETSGVRGFALLSLIVIAMVTYFGLGAVAGALSIAEFKTAFRRRRTSS